MIRLLLLAVLGIAFAPCDADAARAQLGLGPAVWIEEYWDVKPERLDEFVSVYRRDVYALSRTAPGYRGYTLLTNLPDASGYPKLPAAPDKMITPHYGIHLRGSTLTERSVDLGNLLRRTHNVVVIHHLQTWADADGFRRHMEQAHARAHDGERLADRLARTLYPLANNYWETTFRLVVTGIESSGQADLEPRPSPGGWYKEYFEVDAKDLSKFLAAYENNTYAVMRTIPGYKGVTIVTTLPPTPEEAKRSKYTGQLLGGPTEFYVPQPGVMMDGVVRTDTSINYSRLFKGTFTIITYYQLPWETRMLQEMQKNFEIDHPGQDRLKHITKAFFPYIQNHWDMHYRAIESSSALTPPD